MYWEKKKLDYNILIPPLNKPFNSLSLDEAETFFKWFQSHIPTRIEYLAQQSGCTLDYSFESLVPLWKWFLNNAQVEPVTNATKEEMRRHLYNHLKQHIEYVISEEDEQFSLQTLYIIRDVSMYVGEIFVKYSNKIKWSFHTNPEQDSFANIPLLDGFEDANFSPPFHMQFEPTHMIEVVAANLFDNTHKPDDLYKLCVQWCNYIPNS